MKAWTLLALLGACHLSGAQAPGRPPRTYDLKNVEWHVTLHPDTRTIDGRVVNTVHLLTRQDHVDFDCGPFLDLVADVDGARAGIHWSKETLRVDLPDGGAPGDYKVQISYRMKPTGGVYFLDGSVGYPAHTPVVFSQGAAEDNRYWLPTYDYPDNKATSEGYITVPNGWKALSNGKLVETKTETDGVTFHWKMDQPHSTYLISFVAGPYEIGEERWGRMPVQYWVPEGLLPMGLASFGGTNRIIDFYSKQLGVPYPYAKFAQSAVPQFMFGGMENISAVTQTIRTLFPPEEAELRDSTGLVAHELAHQWFGDLITCATWEHTWLNESFATFMPPFYTRSRDGETAFELDREGVIEGAKRLEDSGAVATLDFPYPSDIYRGQIYAGGAARLYMLMNQLGERTFWKGVHDFLLQYSYKPATTDEFFEVMSRDAGRDLRPFMEEWFHSSGIPHFTLRRDGSTLILKEDKPFPLEAPVWVWSGSDWEKLQAKFEPGKLEARIATRYPEGAAFLDPEGRVLAIQDWGLDLPKGQAAAIFDALPTFSKPAYARALRRDQAAVRALLAEPKNLPFRNLLIGSLDRSSADVLSQLFSDPQPRVREAAIHQVRALYSEGPMPAALSSALKSVADGDRDAVLRAAAYAALMQVSSDPFLADKAWVRDVFDEGYRTEALRWWAAHDPSAARRHALEALDGPMTAPVQEAAIRLLGRMKDRPGEHTVFEHLIKVLGGGAFTLRLAALGALGSYGDKAAIPAIEPLATESLWMTRDAAKAALARLR
jgi:aminopeptidase N